MISPISTKSTSNPRTVDGDSGRLTEQQLCAARVALNLPISRADMDPGGAEERTLMAARSLAIPATAPVSASRWVLIDQTCQIMFAGEGGNDFFRGSSFLDDFSGGEGDDTFVYSSDYDRISGGPGSDTLDFSESALGR